MYNAQFDLGLGTYAKTPLTEIFSSFSWRLILYSFSLAIYFIRLMINLLSSSQISTMILVSNMIWCGLSMSCWRETEVSVFPGKKWHDEKLVLSANISTIAKGRWLMKVRNKRGRAMLPWGTQCVTQWLKSCWCNLCGHTAFDKQDFLNNCKLKSSIWYAFSLARRRSCPIKVNAHKTSRITVDNIKEQLVLL